ncbi:Phosphate ABC transporter, periplasmic phosphate-binding protein PstS [Caenispirillum salinarum AK4]|uniref:Phosphate ABC transporter, periplasmic phosphate-binding protein PstS n=1 Tax=Caenispirillum salinarum AK4 TaxID=1238182 RepID=K9HU09_9PROT|nr:PstS family phosphate ABC transporter substrate-binding protein [Caenispirillum salinarum]EKV31716.1 Phosphate ABC transporter, periplasmic phosphate-binding protein PstS [Caenispirillum salinarum AK4]
MIKKTIALAALATVAAAGAAEARDQIRIVGSSTVYPFATVVAENFGKTTEFPTPVIESTGSGGGLKLFCAGVGTEHPDITNASRRIKASELEMCKNNGVEGVTEVRVGYDGIVLASDKSAPEFSVSREQLWQALAAQVPVDGKLVDNPNTKWSDISSDLPNAEIEVLGPPPTSGTRDAFVELVMEEGCEAPLEGIELSEDAHEAACATMREDGAFIEAGENDNLIVQKLQANPNALGIFGYSFLEQNSDAIKGASIDGEKPTFENIASGAYPVSRPLFFYVKNAHVGTIPGMDAYLDEFTSPRAWGPDGYLADKGLIPMDEAEREKFRDQATNLKGLTMDDLK